MLEKERREAIIRLMNEQVVPAVGCTEPMAVALCVARATELLGQRPEKINVLLSGNMLKNAMGVGIPGTGMIGLPIAIALGAIVGKSEYKLEVIKDLTPETLAEGKEYIKGDHITIGLKNQCCDKLYIEGRIRYRYYDDKKGQRRFVTEIYADNMELLTSRQAQQQQPAVAEAEQPKPAPASASINKNNNDDTLPF